MKLIKKLFLTLAFSVVPAAALADSVNINTADAATLAASLKGVGPAKAEAIVAYRDQNGRFASVDDLTKVKGIGPKVVEDNREKIRLD